MEDIKKMYDTHNVWRYVVVNSRKQPVSVFNDYESAKMTIKNNYFVGLYLVDMAFWKLGV